MIAPYPAGGIQDRPDISKEHADKKQKGISMSHEEPMSMPDGPQEESMSMGQPDQESMSKGQPDQESMPMGQPDQKSMSMGEPDQEST